MIIIAQSQPPAAKVSYVHLAYISAQLSNRISKGELLPMQAIFGAAMATAIVCGFVGAKLKNPANRGQAVKWGIILGFFGTLGAFWFAQGIWSATRSNEETVRHVVQTRQFWALREAPIGAGVEAASATNGSAAALAADYYRLKGGSAQENPEFPVKAYRYCELAAAHGQKTRWMRVEELKDYPPRHVEAFQAALKRGKLSQEEQTWVRAQLARVDPQDRGTEPGKHERGALDGIGAPPK